jgi:hypothetical protein
VAVKAPFKVGQQTITTVRAAKTATAIFRNSSIPFMLCCSAIPPSALSESNACWYVRYMSSQDVGEWLLLSVTTGNVASLRVFVWRQLRKLGAVYLHQSVCLLPDRPEVRTRLRPVLGRVRGQGGRARLIPVRISDEENQSLIEEQRRDRDTEYLEVVERVPHFLAEIEMETGRGKATYSEVEESEADLERFEKWLAAIADRDYFDAAAGAEARSAVQRCRDALAAFELAALAADHTDSDGVGIAFSYLRIVKDNR